MCLLFSLPLYMPTNEVDKNLDKLYYSIGEVAKMFEVNASLIRFWEKEFSIIKPKKNKKGNRLFTHKDIQNFKLIYQLVKVEGFTLEGAKQQLKKGKKEVKTSEKEQAIALLKGLKENLLALKAQL